MKKTLILLVIVISANTAFSQDLGDFLEGGVEDGNQLLESYLEPIFQGFGYGLNSGWYNTGKPHKTLGFDLTVTTNMAYVPDNALFYTINPSDYQNLNTAPAENGQTRYPTIMGPNLGADDIPYLVFNENNSDPNDDISITAPTGLGLDEEFGFNAVPVPVASLGIGIIKGTELRLRLIPKQTFGDPGEEFSTGMFGIGVMHDVKQWIPVIKNLPFDLSGFFGYTKMTNEFSFDADNPDQIGEFNVSGTTLQGIISKKLSVLTAYAGVGFISTKTNFNLNGTYETEAGTFTDPVDLSYKSGSLRANAGLRLKLLIFTFHAEYALQKYNTLSAGVGISIR
ncbi:DUF6588 family protein [Marinoscillum sp.]|uniref:DUF6588 family protein n=1 Tax=Marinoscillum sp. TaxID=2024838 RepID=UPI003BAD167F